MKCEWDEASTLLCKRIRSRLFTIEEIIGDNYSSNDGNDLDNQTGESHKESSDSREQIMVV